MSVNSATSSTTASSALSSALSDVKGTTSRGQLHWKMFRKEILAPHHVRVLDTLPGGVLPETVMEWVNANRTNTARFSRQRRHFRKEVSDGRGFGDSALFPHEVLPWAKGHSYIGKCMVPTFSAEPLPERMTGDSESRTSLSQPRPGLGCGFADTAFAEAELSALPDFMQTSGTAIHFETGSIASGTALYCPFLTFERTFHQHKYGMEVARNQCAINGAWCVRAQQMLHARALVEDSTVVFENPVAFSCAIDNTLAIINYHWVDHAQTYCMAPVIKFELTKDEHFNQLLIWIEAIGQWALTRLLPEIKKAVSHLCDFRDQVPALVKPLRRLDTASIREEHNLVTALKISYENIPWRLDGDGDSAGCSSTASWGSPMLGEAFFPKQIPEVYPLPMLPSPPGIGLKQTSRSLRFAGVVDRQVALVAKPDTVSSMVTRLSIKPPLPMQPQPSILDVAPDCSSELVLKKRLDHAMDEIRDLQLQLYGLKQDNSQSTSCIQNELSGLRQTMTSVIRKERLNFKPGRVIPDSPGIIRTDQRFDLQNNASVITTPTEPAPSPAWVRLTAPRKSSGLKHVLSLDTTLSSTVNPTTGQRKVDDVETFYTCQSSVRSPITILSPTIINYNIFGADEAFEESSNSLVRVTSRSTLWSPVVASHILTALVPSAILRVLFLGFILDYCMMSMTGSCTPSLTTYMANVVENAQIF